jgi:MFS family permease
MYASIFLAAPVSYIGVVQAALCDKLGSNATIANLPSATYLLGGLAPLFLSMIVPHRWERAVVVWSNGLTAVFIGVVFFALAAKLPTWIPLTVLVVQGLLQGCSLTTAQVFTFQCLARGTTIEGRNRTFKRTYFLSPIFAVAGSLAAQYVLNGGLRSLPFPYDFAVLYLVGFLCMTAAAICSSRFQLVTLPDEPRRPILRELGDSIRAYAHSRSLVLLFAVYTLWYCALNITPNLALYTRQAIGRDPQDFSGLIMALRFGCKSLGGYLLGAIAIRWGLRMSVIACSLLLVIGTMWGWIAPGYAFLLAFGFLGAGELGGAYIPNYGVALSRPETTARNISLLTLASPASSFSPAVLGLLADRFGFGASFTFALAMALAAIWITMMIRDPQKDAVPAEA